MPPDLADSFCVIEQIIHMRLHCGRIYTSSYAVDPALSGRAVDFLQLSVFSQYFHHFAVFLRDRLYVDGITDSFESFTRVCISIWMIMITYCTIYQAFCLHNVILLCFFEFRHIIDLY